MYFHYLLRLEEDEWKNFKMPILVEGEAVQTGDSIVDEWEQQLQSMSEGTDTDEKPWFEQVREVLNEPT